MNKNAKIVMNSMVGNEARTITRMLESVAPHIDYWVIQCNGNDETEQIINDFFKERNIPGFTYQIEWNFPGWNRDHTLQECLKADHGCDWILRMDADETLEIDEDFDWTLLDNKSILSFNVTAFSHDTKYFRTWMWNARLPWFFQHDKRHETIHLPEIGEDFQRINLSEKFRHKVSQDGETWYVPRKFLRDALELEIDKVVGNKVLEDPYHLWYLAKSYHDSYGSPQDLAFGMEHSREYCRRSTWYWEKYLELTKGWTEGAGPEGGHDEMCYFALMLMAENYKFLGEHEKALIYYDNAQLWTPMRNEALVYKCFLLEFLGRKDEIIQTLDFMLQKDRVNPFPKHTFLIEDRAYYDSSNFLVEWKERLQRTNKEYIIDNSSVDFFN